MVVRFAPLEDDDPASVGGYDLRARLGAGGMGRVYLAFSSGGRALAVKVVRPDYARDEEFRRRFRKEIEAAQRVQGLHTAPVVDAESEASQPWLATAYVPGPSLQQAVTEHGPLPLPTVFRLLAGVAEGLTAIHACNLIHRDLKPANILLADDGPRVIDFGIAHAADATTITSTNVRVGTPAFMAPEQIRGRSATPATDVFTLGNLAVFAATGHTAFGEGNTDALFYRIINEAPDLDDCPPKLRTIVEQCLARDPEKRPAVSKIMEYAREQTAGETLALAGSWLPEAVATSMAEYDTTRYVPPKTKQADTATITAETDTAGETVEAKPPAGGGGSSSGGAFAVIGVLALIAFFIIGPDKVFGAIGDRLKGSPAPTYSPSSDATGTGDDSPVSEPTEEETPSGCERADQVIKGYNDTFDKADAASLSSLASNLDAAADDAGDPDVASAVRDLANDSRTMSDAESHFQAAIDRNDSSQVTAYDAAFNSAAKEFDADADTFKSLCS